MTRFLNKKIKDVARELWIMRKDGLSTVKITHSAGTVVFSLDTGGYCSRFARQCCECAAERPAFSIPYFGRSAKETERKCKANNLSSYESIDDAPPGSLIFFGTTGPYGHVAIWGGYEKGEPIIYENTSDGHRGDPRPPGTKRTVLTNNIMSRITSIYSIFPNAPTVVTVNNEPIDVHVWNEDGHTCVRLREIAEALGIEVDASRYPDAIDLSTI